MKNIAEATNVGSVAFNIISNKGAFTKEVNSAGNTAQNVMGGAMKKVGAAVATAFSVKVVTAFAKECVNLGSDLAEVQNVVDVTFGQSASKINTWAQTTATAFGVSKLHAKRFSGTMGAMLKSMGLSTDSAYDMSTALVGLAGDMASFYNLDVQTAFDKIRSGISGETEPLKQLGINMSVANLEAYALSQGITQSYNSMSQANQAMLRYSYLMSVTADAQGDFSRTSDSWANQTKILSLQFDSLKASVGSLLIQVLTPLLKTLNKIMAAATNATVAIGALFGKKVTTAFDSAGASAGAVSESIADTGTAATAAAKKIKGAFASFDEINVISFDTDSGSGAGASAGYEIAEGASVASAGVSETESRLDSLRSKIVGLWHGFASGFEDERAELFKNIEKLKANIQKVWSDLKTLGSPLKQWASTDLLTYIETYAHTAAAIFLGLFDSLNLMWEDIWNRAVFPVLQKFVTVGLPMITQFKTKSLALFKNVFIGFKQIVDKHWKGGIAPALSVVSDAFNDVIDIISEKWKEYGEPIFTGINTAVTNTKDIILNLWTNHLEPCWNSIMSALDELWKKYLKPLVSEIASFVAEFVVFATNIYNNFIAPVIMWLEEKLAPVFNRVFNNILSVVKPIVSGIVESVKNIISALRGVIEFLSGVFSGDWSKAWSGLEKIASGAWKSLVSGASGAWNGIKTVFSGVGTFFKNTFSTAWSAVKNVFSAGGKVFDGIKDGIVTAFKTVVNALIDGINQVVKLPFEGLNKILDKISALEIAGIKPFKWLTWRAPIPQIPHLAQGGWVAANNPQLAIVGDNKREGEIIAPESKITEAVERAQNIGRELKLMIEVIVNYPDGRRIIKQINQAQLEEGRILLEV